MFSLHLLDVFITVNLFSWIVVRVVGTRELTLRHADFMLTSALKYVRLDFFNLLF